MKVMVFHIDKSTPGQWGNEFTGNIFKVITIRRASVIVKCNMDEGYSPPYNVHEFPLMIGTIKEAETIP